MSSAKYNNPLECPVTRTVHYIGGRWKPIILYLLIGRKLRFGQIGALMPAISKKVLTQQLKELEKEGLIERKQFNEIPLRVEYRLSKTGESAIPILNAMCDWGQKTGRMLDKK